MTRLTIIALLRINICCKVLVVTPDLVDRFLLGSLIVVCSREMVPVIFLLAVLIASLSEINLIASLSEINLIASLSEIKS